MEAVFTVIWRKLILALLSEENHENLRALDGGCVHCHMKKAYCGNSFWGKSRESQGFRGRLSSLVYEASSYWQFFLRKIMKISEPSMEAMFTGIWRKLILVILSEENHENLRALDGGCVHWHMKKAYCGNFFWGKSRESQGLGGRLCSLAYEESSYWQFFLRKITRISGPKLEDVFTGICPSVRLFVTPNKVGTFCQYYRNIFILLMLL
jgi:hypothetical protein